MNRRLDSWKAIAEYLGRDTATARRWEKTLGLPIRRVAGGVGRSVFAYTDDIDAWLASSKDEPADVAAAPVMPEPPELLEAPAPEEPPASLTAHPVPVPPAPSRARRSMITASVAAVVVLAVLGSAAWGTFARPAPAVSRVLASDTGVTAYDSAGREQWRYLFPENTRTALPSFGSATQILSDSASPAVLVSTSHRYTVGGDGPVEGGELIGLDAWGRRQHAFAFDDDVTVRGSKFGPPWIVTGFATAGPASARRIAVAGHHYMWSPSVVTVLDAQWRRTGTFVHDGWIETLGWAGPDRLVAGGFDQIRNGGLVALLDTTTMQPIRMVVMPRTELNLVSASRFNRAVVEVVNGRVMVRTVEMPLELSQGAIDAIYEFSPSLELERASQSDRYWEMHRSLEIQGKLPHSQSECPDRAGPREVLVWEKATGWRTQPIAVAANPL